MTNISFYKAIGLLIAVLGAVGCSESAQPEKSNQILRSRGATEFYSKAAQEVEVEFDAEVETMYDNVDQFKFMNARDKEDFILGYIQPTVKFLFGPLTNRSLGGEQKGLAIEPNFDKAYVKNGKVMVPYLYRATWLVAQQVDLSKNLELPLPYNDETVYSPKWKSCTDSAPDHQTRDFFWYFWDPERYGCDHQLGQQYQNIQVRFGKVTQQTQQTFPEYNKMIENKVMKMTFAFGYVEDVSNADPFTNRDAGMLEFQKFVRFVEKWGNNSSVTNFKYEPILESRYFRPVRKNAAIGRKYTFDRGGISYEIKVVSSTDIDQMELFAVSFAEDHDSFFGWFGHSRVGNGFDADQFDLMMRRYPKRLSISSSYQMIYWAGCNSYSYYTKPFFDFKKKISIMDTNGTQSLDIISNGLPSYFSLNAANGKVLLDALVQVEQKASYQSIIDKIEVQSGQWGIQVLVNVLGDEDNQSGVR